VAPTLEAANLLTEKGRKVRVVSMPSTTLFDMQGKEYQNEVLPRSVTARVAVEAAHGDQWRKYLGLDGATVTLDTFGESGKGGDLMKHFGFTAENIAKTAESLL
jgi:transketolase